MLPLGSRSIRSEIVGDDAIGEALSGWSGDADRRLDVETVDPDAVRNGERQADCVVVDSGALGTDCVDVVEDCPDDQPVVVLVDGAEGVAADALAAGATETIPRSVADTEPGVLAEQLVSTVEREHARSGVRDLFENVSDGLVVHDETGEIREVNDRYCALTGYTREELVGSNVRRIVPDDPDYTYEDALERIERARQEGPQLFEFKTSRKDGETFTAEVNLSVVDLHGNEWVLASVRDVTERKRREREYEQIFNSVNDTIAVIDPDSGEMLDANESLCELLGYDREELLELGPAEISVTEEGYTEQRGQEFIDSVVESGKPRRTEWMVETSDGSVRWLEINGTTATIGGETRYLSIGRDITERKRRERERRLAEERFDLVARNVDEAIFIARGPHPPSSSQDADASTEAGSEPALARWEFEYLTPAVEHALDRPVEEVYEDPTALMELLVPEDRPEYDEWLREVSDEMARGELRESYTVEYRVRDSEGAVRWMRTNAYPAPLDSEDVYRLVGITEDITDQRERQHRLRAERDRRSVLFENTPDPIMAVTFVGGRPHITEVNEAFEEVFGFDEDTVGDQPIVEVLIPDGEREEFDRIRKQVIRGEPVEAEVRRETADGQREFLLRVLPFRTEGERHAYVWYTDVTERKRRERMIETLHDATERLQDAETTEAVCRTAVRAARDVLDLPMTACWLHRETEDGPVLENVAATEPVRELDPAPFRPGDVEYEAFRDGETLIYDPSEYFPQNPLDAAIMLPLGEHGLLAVGKEGIEEYDEFVADAARTLAGHVRTALDRVARAEQLRESERRVQAILDRIDEAIFLAPATEINDSDPAPEYVSSGYEDIFGLSLEAMHETYEEGFFGTLHPDDYDDYWAFVDGIHRDVVDGDTEDRYSREYRIERPDGETRWVHSDYYPTQWEDGECKIVILTRDVTERKERERTLESFHDATAELTTAETVDEAGRIAVEAAAEVFELPATAVYRYDEGGGVLEPAAVGPGVGDDLPDITADDEAAWGAFVEERMRRVSVDDVPALSGGPNDEALLVPLGGNGLIAVWHAGESLDPDAANIMAATVEAALNRLRGERRLQSRSEELEAQVERARRLEAVTELTRRVEAAITAESSRLGVQEAVCEELTDVDPFEAAWVAEADVGTDRLTPRTAAGIDRDDAEKALADADHGDPHPAREAWRTGEPSVVTDLVGGRRSDWRRPLLRQGAGAVCAIPLAYSGVTHGVLTIVADEPDAFGDREVDVLDQLGTSIGYAITAIERQRALESDDTLELEFEGSGGDLPLARLASEVGCRVRHERTVRRQDGSVSVYYTLAGDLPEDVAAAAAETLPGTVETVTRGDGEAVIERTGSSWFGSVVSEYGGVLRRGRATPSDVTLVVELPQDADTRTIVDRVTDAFPGLELTAQRQHRETPTTPQEVGDQLERRLTDRQYEAIETAHAMGYFDWPRESSGEDVADALDITQPTVNKHIRLGERKVFELLFGSNGD